MPGQSGAGYPLPPGATLPELAFAGAPPFVQSSIPTEDLPPALQAYRQKRELEDAAKPTEPRWGDPMQAAAEAEAAQAAEPAPTPAPSFGAGRIQRELEQMGKEPGDSAYLDEYQASLKRQEESAGRMAEEMGAVQGQLQGLLETEAAQRRNHQEALEAAKAKMERASKAAEYPGLSIDEIERHQAIIDDPYNEYSDEQKRTAKLALKRASEIDPHRLLNRSTMTSILAGVAQFLGAYASSLSGGKIPNFAMQTIENALERDIMAQKAAFEQKGRAAGRARSFYADLRAQFDSDEQAITAQRSVLLGMSAQIAEKYKATDLAEQLKQRGLQERAKVEEMETDNRRSALTAAGNMALQRQQMAILDKKADGGEQPLPGGTTVIKGKRPPKMTVNSAPYKMMHAYNSVTPILDDLIDMRGEYSAEILNRYAVRDARALHALVRSEIRKVMNTGAHLSAEEVRMLDALTASDPTDTGFVLQTLKSLRAALQRSTNGALRTYNLQLESMDAGLRMAAPTPGKK